MRLDFDGVYDYVPDRYVVLFRIYSRALRDGEVELLYRGYRVVEPTARGVALVKKYPDRVVIKAVVVSRA